MMSRKLMVQLGTSVSVSLPLSSMRTSTSWTGMSVGRSNDMWVPSSVSKESRTSPMRSA